MPSTGITIDAQAPSIEGTLTDGRMFKLEDLKGKYVLIDFWGSWCPPCIKEAPAVVQLYDHYKNKKFNNADGFEILSIALERNDKTWAKASNRLGIDWPYQLVDISRFVASSSIASSYGVRDIPSKFLLNPEGNFISIKGSIEEIRYLLDQNVIQ